MAIQHVKEIQLREARGVLAPNRERVGAARVDEERGRREAIARLGGRGREQRRQALGLFDLALRLGFPLSGETLRFLIVRVGWPASHGAKKTF
ncbi:hypothetical protein [Methylocella silvestris]|uniref:hypothetical protein n=1 Tax=Methylocella silvestris TaxID=199596 RepID=UPI001FDEBCDC|nr:hypothetical protein [Methylocella silvestris]